MSVARVGVLKFAEISFRWARSILIHQDLRPGSGYKGSFHDVDAVCGWMCTFSKSRQYKDGSAGDIYCGPDVFLGGFQVRDAIYIYCSLGGSFGDLCSSRLVSPQNAHQARRVNCPWRSPPSNPHRCRWTKCAGVLICEMRPVPVQTAIRVIIMPTKG